MLLSFFGGHMWGHRGYDGYGPSLWMWIPMIIMQVVMLAVVALIVIALLKYIKKD